MLELGEWIFTIHFLLPVFVSQKDAPQFCFIRTCLTQVPFWDCPPKKNNSISRLSQCPNTTYIYVQVTKPSSGHSHYDERKGGSKEPHCRATKSSWRGGQGWGWMGQQNFRLTRETAVQFPFFELWSSLQAIYFQIFHLKMLHFSLYFSTVVGLAHRDIKPDTVLLQAIHPCRPPRTHDFGYTVCINKILLVEVK